MGRAIELIGFLGAVEGVTCMRQVSDRLVELHRCGVNVRGNWLVRDVNLTVARGQIVTLIGPNGSGKSTTAKLALGVLRASEGQVERINGLRIGYVPQRITVEWTLPLTVSRFMSLTHRLSRADRLAALEQTGVAHLDGAEFATLSGGETQRVLLARALSRKPDLLVLDEPAQGVDYQGEIALYELIVQARDRFNCGVLMVSHDLHVVMAATDQVLCLNGHVCCRGTPSSIAEQPEFRALFGSRGSEALAIYRHKHDHVHLPDGRVQHADGSITDHCHPGDGAHNHQGLENAAPDRRALKTEAEQRVG